MPDIGQLPRDVPVIEVLVKAGDTVAKDQGLITLESDKATMEVPSSAAGVVKEVKVKVGDEVSEGTVVVTVEAGDAAQKPAAAKTEAPAKTESAPKQETKPEPPKAETPKETAPETSLKASAR